jgi:hypothetical protein
MDLHPHTLSEFAIPTYHPDLRGLVALTRLAIVLMRDLSFTMPCGSNVMRMIPKPQEQPPQAHRLHLSTVLLSLLHRPHIALTSHADQKHSVHPHCNGEFWELRWMQCS